LPKELKTPKLIVVDRATATDINRQPLDAKEIERLLEAARVDPLIFDSLSPDFQRGVRRGDVCALRWESVNLKAGVLI
jgi:integrase